MSNTSLLSSYTGKRILITGGAGCIGTNLTTTLLKAEPEKIIVIDDFSASYEWNVPKDPRVMLIKGNILDEERMKRAFSFKPHYVFHLAAHFANQNSVDHPETDLLVNGLGTLKTLEYANLAGVERFVFASSGCSVYGSQAPLTLFPLPFVNYVLGSRLYFNVPLQLYASIAIYPMLQDSSVMKRMISILSSCLALVYSLLAVANTGFFPVKA